MSQMIDFTVPSTVPGRSLHAFRCVPDGEVKAILQLSHGMVEFIDRYKPLAEYLAGRSILVTGHDHLGHGGSIRTRDDYGYFAEPDGNRAVLADLHAMTVRTKELYPGVPYFLLGHSMGSFYARQYLCEYGHELDGAIIMGTGFQPKALVQFAKTLCRVLAVFHGWHYRSNFVAHTSFLGYNKGLEGRTTHDWLNRDHAEVDKYLADERCTFTFTLNAYYSMFSGILRLHDPAFLAKMPKDLPLLFLAGDADPVGEQGKGVRRAIQSLKDAGVQNIECKLYPGARHELLMETNKQEVFADIADWLDRPEPHPETAAQRFVRRFLFFAGFRAHCIFHRYFTFCSSGGSATAPSQAVTAASQYRISTVSLPFQKCFKPLRSNSHIFPIHRLFV